MSTGGFYLDNHWFEQRVKKRKKGGRMSFILYSNIIRNMSHYSFVGQTFFLHLIINMRRIKQNDATKISV
jgi:hypothetical protein